MRVLTTGIGGAVAGLSILAYFDIIRPVQVLQAVGYAALLFVMDYAFISDLAFGLRFIAPDLFGFLSLSTIVSGVTAVGHCLSHGDGIDLNDRHSVLHGEWSCWSKQQLHQFYRNS